MHGEKNKIFYQNRKKSQERLFYHSVWPWLLSVIVAGVVSTAAVNLTRLYQYHLSSVTKHMWPNGLVV